MKKLTVIIVNFNVKFYVEQCLVSLQKALEGIDSEIYIVDNHSRDDSVGYLRRRYRDVNIVVSNHNLGFARANNVAIRQSESEYVLLINPDTFVAENTIREALDFMDSHADAGGVGVMMHNPNGTVAMESRRGLPTPITSFYKMTGLCARFPKSRTFAKYYMSYLSWDSPQQIDIISGAFCMLRRKAIDDVGILDEDFFMYGEYIDLSYRLLKGGWHNWYLPLHILHYKGESTQKSSFHYIHVFYQAMLIFFRKHYGHFNIWLSLPIKTAIYFKAFLALIKTQVYNTRKSLGFNVRKRPYPTYCFVGAQRMLQQCRQITRAKGLTAVFHSYEEPIDIENWVDTSNGQPVYLVLDTTHFSFAEVIDIIKGIQNPNITLGTFNSKTKVLITPEEVLRQQ